MAKESKDVYAAIADAQAEIRAAGKDSTNTFHKYKYVSADGMIEHCRDVLTKHGITLMQCSVARSVANTDTDSRPIEWLRVGYMACHATSGTRHEWAQDIPAVAEKGRPLDKAVCGAMTVSLSYAIRGLLLVPREDENEPDRRDDRNYAPPSRATAPARPAQAAPAEPTPISWTDPDLGENVETEIITGTVKHAHSKAGNGATVHSVTIIGKNESGANSGVTARSFHRTPGLIAYQAERDGLSLRMAYRKGKMGNEIAGLSPDPKEMAMIDENELPF